LSLSILLVEDDFEMCELLKTYLIKERYSIVTASDGLAAISLLQESIYQLVVLDLMIPERDGYEVLEFIRKNGNIPVLIISSKDEEMDKILGLRLGADDYMTKPFGLGEFIARVKALLRRYVDFNPLNSVINEELHHRNLTVNLMTFEVKVAGKPIFLTSTEFDILKLFIINPNKVFTKQEIFKNVWLQEYLNDENTIIVHIRRMRCKIEKDPSDPQYIQTVWGIGYKLGMGNGE
jgi:DNA-binding response OmpR family regulator